MRCLHDMQVAEAEECFEDAEIVCEGIQCWLGDRQVSYRTVQALLRLLLVSESGDRQVHRYTLNDCGRGVLRRPALAEEIAHALRAGGAFTITPDARLQMT